MKINGVEIEDTFAEAFPMKATRIIITGVNEKWAFNAAKSLNGVCLISYACGCEAGIEKALSPKELLMVVLVIQ